MREKCRISLFVSKATLDNVGKAATAKEIPKIPIKKDCKLLAKLKTDKEPTLKVEAIIVIINKLICEMPKLNTRGIIILTIFLKFPSLKSKIKEFKYMKTEDKKDIINKFYSFLNTYMKMSHIELLQNYKVKMENKA